MKTKKIKFLAIAFTLILGISFTSCLNSDNDTTATRQYFAKVYSSYGYYYFKTADGVTITPTTASIANWEATNKVQLSSYMNQFVFIVVTWDTSLVTVPDNSTSITNVDFGGLLPFDGTAEVVENKGASNDSISNAPIISLESSASGMKPYFFDATTLILPVNYYMNAKYHYFTLVYYPDEQVNGGPLTLYLRHNNKGDSGTSTSSLDYANQSYYNYGYLRLLYKDFDLTRIFQAYKDKTGVSVAPTKVNVVTTENPISISLSDSQTAQKTYTVEYKPTAAN